MWSSGNPVTDAAIDDMFADRGGVNGSVDLTAEVAVLTQVELSVEEEFVSPFDATWHVFTLPAGVGIFFEMTAGAPAGATVGLYWFDDDGLPIWLDQVEVGAPGTRVVLPSLVPPDGAVSLQIYVLAPGGGLVVTAPTVHILEPTVTPIACETVTVTRELAGDLPADVTLVGGAVSASCELDTDLLSPGPHPADVLDRAEWLGASTVIRAGYDGHAVDVPVFDGVMRQIGFDEDTKRRPMSVMNRSDQMRAPVTIPHYGSVADRPKPDVVRRYPTNLTAVLVAALHASGIRITPAPLAPNTVMAVPLVAGCLADVGLSVPAGTSVPAGATWLQPGPFGPRPHSPYVGWAPRLRPSRRIGPETLAIEINVWMDTQVNNGSAIRVHIGADRHLIVDTNAGAVRAFVRNGGGDATYASRTTTPATAGWHHVAAQVVFGGSPTLRLRVDDGAESSVAVVGAGAQLGASVDRPGVMADLVLLNLQQFSVHAHPTGRATSSVARTAALAAYPAADLDLAALEVDDMPAVDARVAWELCKEIASAELGMVGFDEEGRFYFKNRDSLNAATTPVQTWDTDLVDNIAGTASYDSVRDKVSTTVTRRWQVLSATSPYVALPVPVYKGGDVLTIPVGQTNFLLNVDEGAVPDISVTTGVATPSAVNAYSTMTLCSDPLGASPYTTAGTVIATVHPVDSTTWRLTVRNTSGATRYAVWPTAWASSGSTSYQGLSGGQGSLVLMGRTRVATAGSDYTFTTVKPTAVTVGIGARLLEIEESPWRQDVTSTTALLAKILADLATPRLELADVTIPADLRLQIGDPVQLNDWAGRVPPILARIVRLRTVIGQTVSGGMEQTVSLRSIA